MALPADATYLLTSLPNCHPRTISAVSYQRPELAQTFLQHPETELPTALQAMIRAPRLMNAEYRWRP